MMDVDKVERALAYITDHPEEHNQKVWTCETGACFAGHLALLDGWKVSRYHDGRVSYDLLEKDGVRRTARTIGTEILGLNSSDLADDYDRASVIFAASNDREKIALMIKDLANGEDLLDHWVSTHADDDEYPTYERVE